MSVIYRAWTSLGNKLVIAGALVQHANNSCWAITNTCITFKECFKNACLYNDLTEYTCTLLGYF